MFTLHTHLFDYTFYLVFYDIICPVFYPWKMDNAFYFGVTQIQPYCTAVVSLN